MNAEMKTGPNGLRLLMHFEKGPTDGSVPLSENGAALAPYVCPGDELTIGYGCTHWFDGSEVAIHHRLKDEAEAVALLKYNLPEYERAVIKGATRPMTQNQFDAFVSRAFNIGTAAFLGSSALRSFNEGRFEDAASDFGMWTGSTTARPPKKYRDDPEYADKLIQDHKGLWRWKGPDGQYCRYMLRLSGLLDRCYSESLVFMNRDFMRTIRGPERMKLELIPTPAAEAKWNGTKGRWEEGTKFRTPFKEVLAKAWNDPLPPLSEPADAIPFEPPPAKPFDLDAFEADVAKATQPIPEDVLVLDTPAASGTPDAKAGQPGADKPPSPTSPAAPAPTIPAATGSGHAGPATAPKPAPVEAPSPTHPGNAPVPPVVFKKDEPKPKEPEKPKAPVVIAPKAIDPKSIPYGDVDPSLATNMSDSRRVAGMVVVGLGSMTQILAAREIISSSVGAVFYDMSRDPIVVALFVGGVFWVVGWLTRKRGTQIVTKGMVEAKSVLK